MNKSVICALPVLGDHKFLKVSLSMKKYLDFATEK